MLLFIIYLSFELFRNPYNPDCLAPYKGPIIPEIAIGGYLEEGEYDSLDYIKATGLVLTFLVKNSLNEEDLAPIIKWEQRYVKYNKKTEIHTKSNL